MNREIIEDTLAEKYTGYLLITCSGPDQDGEMHVEMTHQGDPVLISYLLKEAQNVVDEEAVQQI